MGAIKLLLLERHMNPIFNTQRRWLWVLLFVCYCACGAAFAAVEGAEPNNTCDTAQDLSEIALPFNLSGNLDGAVNPDVDYYKITGAPSSAIEIQLKGADSGSGSLADPHLGIFNSDCASIGSGFDVSAQNRDAKIRFRFPDNGVLILAASQCCDNFDLGGNGTYQLVIQPVETVSSINFKISNAVTGALLSGGYSLLIVPPNGNFILFTEEIAPGEFRATSDISGQPLVSGNYSLHISPITQSFFNDYEDYDSTFSVPAATQDYFTEFKLQPTSRFTTALSGRIVDAITGQPLVANLVAQQGDAFGTFSEPFAFTDQDGKFKFNDLFGGTRIFTQLNINADQYQNFSTSVNFTEANPNLDLGDIKLTSNPVRYTNIIPCKKIPRKGGSCVYSVRVTNGMASKLNGEIWSIAQTFGPAISRTVEFQPKIQGLELKPGESKYVSFRFPLPSTVSDNTSICAIAYVGRKPASMWDVVGFKDLFCITKGEMGYAVMPEHEARKLTRKHW